MKNSIFGKAMFAALGAAALFLAAPAGAQVSTMRMEIPFAFVAGDQLLPAGQYVVTVDQDFNRCLFANQSNTNAQMIRLESATESRRLAKASLGTLRFTRYGGQHFLSAVWRPGHEEGNRVVASKRLLEAARSKVYGGDVGPTVTNLTTPNE